MNNEALVKELRELASWNRTPRIRTALQIAADVIEQMSSPYDRLVEDCSTLKKDLDALLGQFNCDECKGPDPTCNVTGNNHCARGKF